MKTNAAELESRLTNLRLPFIKEHCQSFAATAAKNSLCHLDYLAQLIEGEDARRADRAVARRIQAARFPVIKTLDSTITSAVLDRLLHHGETVLIEGSSFRMKDRIET